MQNQFSRTEILIGKEKVEKLQKRKVAIFGIGGVGSYVVEGLVRAGVGHFILVDNDEIEITNLNRQIIATRKTMGKSKVEVSKERILEINPEAKVEIFQEFFMPETQGILDENVDYIVDCVDTVTAKIELVVRAKDQNIPIISSMGTGNKLDPSKFEVADIYHTSVCPLARVMRKELKVRNIHSLKVVYSKEEPIKVESYVPRKHFICAFCCRFNHSWRSCKGFNKIGVFMERYEEIEKSIITTYRNKIWTKFVKGVKEFEMIANGDKIAVCISGGKDSMLMAKCFQELKKHRKMDFELVFLVMNPGYNEENTRKIIENAKIMNLPIIMFDTDIFNRVVNIDDHPCYICARMRRGYLYEKAQELGCNKIALGHHFDDVIETTLMGMLYGAQMQTMMPKVCSTSHPGMELIRPLYYVKEENIIRWAKRNELEFIQCACRFTEHYTACHNQDGSSKREEIKCLIKDLRKKYENIDINIFRSSQNVNLDTLISYRKNGKTVHFLEEYGKKGGENGK